MPAAADGAAEAAGGTGAGAGADPEAYGHAGAGRAGGGESTGTGWENQPLAHNARVWNYWLGGKDYYDVDAQVGDRVAALHPGIRDVARADRAFLGRAVTYLARDAGVRQFLDIGTGLPTVDNTHEVAQRIDPGARIVYVDNDPIVLTHARALLAGTREGATAYLDADAHDPDAVLAGAAETLDLSRPVAVMLLGILNFVSDTEQAREIVRRLVDAVPPGSHVALTHPTLELGGESNEEAMRFWNENATPPIVARSEAEIASFLTGLEILEPGIVSCALWRPDADGGPYAGNGPAAPVPQFGVVARKP